MTISETAMENISYSLIRRVQLWLEYSLLSNHLWRIFLRVHIWEVFLTARSISSLVLDMREAISLIVWVIISIIVCTTHSSNKVLSFTFILWFWSIVWYCLILIGCLSRKDIGIRILNCIWVVMGWWIIHLSITNIWLLIAIMIVPIVLDFGHPYGLLSIIIGVRSDARWAFITLNLISGCFR